MPRAPAFTFVELLIAATMMSVLFVGLSSHLRGGLTVWHRAQEGSDALQRRRMALERLEHDLAQAFVYDARPESYGEEGKLPWPLFTDGTLQFFTIVPATRAQPAAVRIVSYGCEERAGGRGLWRTSRSVSEARLGLEGKSELILAGCERLELRYAAIPSEAGGPLAWQLAWDDAYNNVPRLIEVTARLVSGETLRRTVAAPAGVLGTAGP